MFDEIKLQHNKALYPLTKLHNQYHLANDDTHGIRLQNVGPLSVTDRTVVRLESRLYTNAMNNCAAFSLESLFTVAMQHDANF